MNNFLKQKSKVNMTPMIDVVFLLLVFFMVTTQMKKQEADLGIKLPAPTTEREPSDNIHFIEVLGDGSVQIDGAPTGDSPKELTFDLLANRLKLLKKMYDNTETKMLVTIAAHDFPSHEQSIKVLNACRNAKIEYLSFRH